MFRKLGVFFISSLILLNVYGCVAVVAGAAAGAGTAAWLSGKLSQVVNAPFDKTISATRDALRSMDLDITKETQEEGTAQILSKYTDGKTIWVDIHKVSETSSKVEVRVGAVSGDKGASEKILASIQRRL